MPICFWDTETTGKRPRKKSGKPEPDIVQLAAILTDDDLTEISSLNCIVMPTYWAIPDDVAKIHGISHDKAERFGLSLPTALGVFEEFADIADRFVAHNQEFDVAVVRNAYSSRLKRDFDPFAGKEVRCTMKAAKPLLKLPNRNPTIPDPYKYPKLEECHQYFFNEPITGAHDALVDVRATIRVYKALCEHYQMEP